MKILLAALEVAAPEFAALDVAAVIIIACALPVEIMSTNAISKKGYDEKIVKKVVIKIMILFFINI